MGGIVAAISTFASWVAASGAISAFLVRMAITFATSLLVTRIFGKKPPKPTDNGVRQQIPPATVNSLPIMYGDAYLGGVFVDAALSQDQKVMYYVLALSNISPNGQFSYDQTKFYYGDRLVAFDATDRTKVISLTDGLGNVSTLIKNNLYISLYTSSNTGVITSTNGASAPSVVMSYSATDKKTVPAALAWASSNRQMNNIAFAIVKLVYNADEGITGLLPITFHCSHYLNSTGAAKAGDVWADYLRNVEYGGAVDESLIDTASATALNTYGDELVTFTDSSGNPQTQARYRINGVLDTGTNVLDNIEHILISCDSWMAYNAASGQWSIVINKANTVAMAFNDSNIIDDIKVSAIDINQSINQIEAKFPNSANKDVPDIVYLKTPTGLLFPNEPINKYSISFDLCNNSVQAQYLANRILEQAREDLIVEIKTTYIGIQVNAGDVVSITNSSYGWTNKLFRVMKVNEASLPDGNLGAAFQLNEYNAQVYDDKDITQYQPTPNSDQPSLSYFNDLVAPAVTDQIPNAAVPTFSVSCVLPAVGQVLSVYLYYTNIATPSTTDWNLWGVQTASNAEPFLNGSTLKFNHIGLPTDTYYFAFKVANNIGQSALSATSTAYSWLPNPSSSAVAGTFIPQFSPPTLQVPYTSGAPVFSYITPQLYGSTAGGSVDFVASQTDSDSLFVANTWRIGGSSTTGYGDIVKTNITIANPTDGGFYALWGNPSAMSASPATISVPVRYKAADGTIYQSSTAILQLVYALQGDTGTAGASGNQHAVASLYQWATATPSNPNGNSTFTWATSVNSGYSGGNGWTTTIPSNPATPSIKLWSATKGVSDLATATTTTVDWTTGFAVQDITQNGATGATGTQSASPVVFQWALTIPSSPTGSSTYTWSAGTFTPTPSGWTLTAGTSPTAGYTLWQARVNLIDSASASTTSINWTTSSISAVGYAGSTGASGSSSRLTFARVASNPTPVSGDITTSGSTSFPTSGQSSTTWGFSATWGASDPSPSSTNSLYQSDGIYNPSTGNTVWGTPYISSLKVGSLSAITVNTGGLTVSDYIQAGSAAVSGTSMTGTGMVQNSSGTFAFGNSTKNLSFNGSTLTMNGDLVVTGNLVNNAITSPFQGATYTPQTLPSTTGDNTLSWTPTITAPTAGVLLITQTLVVANRSTSTNYKVQVFAGIDNATYLPAVPIVYLQSSLAYDARMPIGILFPDGLYYTSGSCTVITLTESVDVTAGQTITLTPTIYTNATSTNLCFAGGSYTAILMKK